MKQGKRKNHRPILLLGAFSPELIPFKKYLSRKINIIFETTEIGFTQAAAKTTKLILKYKPKLVIFVGSCGSYSKKIPLKSLIAATQCNLSDLSFAQNKSYNPKNYPLIFKADNKTLPALKINKLIYKPISSSISITKDRKTAKLFAQKNDYIENLELYGVAQACHNQDTPWITFCPVTNYIGKNAHREWKHNFKNYQVPNEIIKAIEILTR